MNAIKWTDQEISLLRDNYAYASKVELQNLFPNRTYGSIKNRATFLKLKKGPGNYGRKIWNEKELSEIKELYSNTQNDELAIKFNCSIHSVIKIASKLGLKKSDDFKRLFVTEAFLEAGKKTRFNPGCVSFNKGLKMEQFLNAEQIEKVKKTQFKKGQVPHNWKPLGFERKTRDGYIEIKVRDEYGEKRVKNFELKHRLLWEEHNGPVPKGMMIKFKDGNKENIVIENLFIASMGENLVENSFSDTSVIKRFLGVKEPKEVEFIKENAPMLIEAKRNQIKLNQKLKETCKTS